jgi:glycosyltransferase involved in cell wall biosynthesis
MPGPKRQTVMIVQETLPHYRVAFFEQLRERLAQEGISLRVQHGFPEGDAAARSDQGELGWASPVANRYLAAGRRQLVWQPAWRTSAGTDLVIVEQASRLLLNYALLARQAVRPPAVAFWGHGRNYQHRDASRLGEYLKRRYSVLPSWWFAYTAGSAAAVTGLGFPAERVTAVGNTIDTDAAQSAIAALRAGGVRPAQYACAFVGGLYPGKRLDLLLEIADRLAEHVPDFCLTVIGDGPLRELLAGQAASRPHVRLCGVLTDERKAAELARCRMLLMPGTVGLIAVDSLRLGLPLLTFAGQDHSPEFGYLTAGVTSLVMKSDASADSAAAAILELLDNASEYQRLAANCRQAGESYSLPNMVDAFATGIAGALEFSRRRVRR